MVNTWLRLVVYFPRNRLWKGFSLPRIVKPSTFRTINLHCWERSFISFWDTFPLFCPKCCPCLFLGDTGRGSQKIFQGLFGFYWDHCIRCLDSVCQFGYWRRQGGRWFGNFGGWILKQPHLGWWLCVVYICVHIYIICIFFIFRYRNCLYSWPDDFNIWSLKQSRGTPRHDWNLQRNAFFIFI